MKIIPKPNPKVAIRYDGEFASYLEILNVIRGDNGTRSPYTLSMWERDRPIYILNRGKVTHTIFAGDVIVKSQSDLFDPFKVITLFELEDEYDILE